jgi:hypothetical protein
MTTQFPAGAMGRRAFLRTLGAASLAAGAARTPAFAAPARRDSLALQLYKSLGEEKAKALTIPAGDPRRDFISNWWYIHPKHRLNNTFSPEQLELIQKIFDGLHSPEHQEAVNRQVLKDQYGKAQNSPSVGFFGAPQDADFEFVYTGHHVTRRCAVNADAGRGFGGRPVFYGHFPEQFNETKDHPGNPYWYQGKVLNEFIATLDGARRDRIVVEGEPRSEQPAEVVRMKSKDWPGLRLGELAADQKKAFVETVRRMLSMFRKDDVDATVGVLQRAEVLDGLHLSCYGGEYDLGSDKVWDTWQIEGPGLVWYFRGKPHIHCYFHLKA